MCRTFDMLGWPRCFSLFRLAEVVGEGSKYVKCYEQGSFRQKTPHLSVLCDGAVSIGAGSLSLLCSPLLLIECVTLPQEAYPKVLSLSFVLVQKIKRSPGLSLVFILNSPSLQCLDLLRPCPLPLPTSYWSDLCLLLCRHFSLVFD